MLHFIRVRDKLPQHVEREKITHTGNLKEAIEGMGEEERKRVAEGRKQKSLYGCYRSKNK